MNTLLIANRGEIARRIIRACRKLGIRSAVVYAQADAQMPFVREADIAIALAGTQAAETYLNIDKILAAAEMAAADALHPGYGFLSENADFARRVMAAGLVWVGPTLEAIAKMGLKAAAKAIAAAEGVPVIPGYRGMEQDTEILLEKALEIGFPLLLKASAGGGGKGMRIVHEVEQLTEAIESAKREALKSFGDGTLLIEKYFPSARHIEIQILGDKYGHCIHLLERECSIQRRYQKVVEESPSPVLNEAQRQSMGEAAVKLCKSIGYDNAGTVEFIYTSEGQFYFLEVNTRLQVEHPVTELITGVDLVEWQIRIAEGEPLNLQQSDIQASGYALELRLYAENPLNNFMPVTGTICDYYEPKLEGLRYDSGVELGSEIGVYYDPMLAKIIAYGVDRKTTIRRMLTALRQLRCQGLVTNQNFLIALMQDPHFQIGEYDTHFLAKQFSVEKTIQLPTDVKIASTIALCLYRSWQRGLNQKMLTKIPLGWRNNFYQNQQESYFCDGEAFQLSYRIEQNQYHLQIDGKAYIAEICMVSDKEIRLLINGVQQSYFIAKANEESQNLYFVQTPLHASVEIAIKDRYPKVEQEKVKGGYIAQIPGEITKVLVKEGDTVAEGASLLILVSMKMENTIVAEEAGKVVEVLVKEGDTVQAGTDLLTITHE